MFESQTDVGVGVEGVELVHLLVGRADVEGDRVRVGVGAILDMGVGGSEVHRESEHGVAGLGLEFGDDHAFHIVGGDVDAVEGILHHVGFVAATAAGKVFFGSHHGVADGHDAVAQET